MSEMTCILCPIGCRMKVASGAGGVAVTGNSCSRGSNYAREEALQPKRILTGVVAVVGHAQPLPVRTAQPIPKAQLFLAMAVIQEIQVGPPITVGQVLKRNLAGTGIDLIATKSM